METILEEQLDDKKTTEAFEFCRKLMTEDAETFEESVDLVKKLGLGGFWKGIHLAIMNTAKALQKAQARSRGK